MVDLCLSWFLSFAARYRVVLKGNCLQSLSISTFFLSHKVLATTAFLSFILREFVSELTRLLLPCKQKTHLDLYLRVQWLVNCQKLVLAFSDACPMFSALLWSNFGSSVCDQFDGFVFSRIVSAAFRYANHLQFSLYLRTCSWKLFEEIWRFRDVFHFVVLS